MKTDQEIQVACKEAMSLLPKGAIVNLIWLTQMTIIKVSNDTNPDAAVCHDCYSEAFALNGDAVKQWIKKSINGASFIDIYHGGIVLVGERVRPRPYHIAESNINGLGVFASRKIRSGEKIVSPSISYYIGYKMWHGFNHSCNNNMVLNEYTTIALRDIQKGDELTVYYGQRPPVNCNCQSASCPNKR